jgi:hypothetical protein
MTRTTPLTWMSHDLTMPGPSSLRSLSLATWSMNSGIGSTIIVQIPDFSKLPDPAQKIDLLLEKAAEVEHALMVQYLYSAYSLNLSVTDAQQKADIVDWQRTIRGIAQEEMGHLMTVQNLRLLLGLEPSFIRDDLPMVAGLFPFKTSLNPLDQKTLAEYVIAESPDGRTDIDDIINLATGSGTMLINRVGVLYALIGVVLASNLDEIEQDAQGKDEWSEMVRQVAYLAYEQHPPSKQWHLLDGAFKPGSVSRQAVQNDWSPNNPAVMTPTLKTRQDAKAAIKAIGLQGEGPGESTDMPSHFVRFRRIYRGHDAIRPFPDAKGWVPTLKVPTDPAISDDSSIPGAITNKKTQAWARLADLRYLILLGFLEEYLTAKPVVKDRSALAKALVMTEMKFVIHGLSAKLVSLPRGTTADEVAALPFGLPKGDYSLPTDPAARRKIHTDRLTEAMQLEEQILKDEGLKSDPLISRMQADDHLYLDLLKVS